MTAVGVGRDVWSTLADPPGRIGIAAPRANEIGRLAHLLSPALLAFLLRRVDIDPAPWIAPEAERASRLLNRFQRINGARWVGRLAAAGIDVVVIKGLATAHRAYPDPDLRAMSDADVLIRRRDLTRTVDFLHAAGFAFAGAPRSRWGFVADASFLPLVSAEGATAIDIHVHPDAYPVHRGLATEDVFSAATEITVDGSRLRVPCATHLLLLAATHAARDRFDRSAVRGLVDGWLILADGMPIDWSEVERRAQRGGFTTALRTFFMLLGSLGLSRAGVPGSLIEMRGAARRGAFASLLADWRRAFPDPTPPLRLLWREALLCTEPSVAITLAWRRARGMLRPRAGLPAIERLSPPA